MTEDTLPDYCRAAEVAAAAAARDPAGGRTAAAIASYLTSLLTAVAALSAAMRHNDGPGAQAAIDAHTATIARLATLLDLDMGLMTAMASAMLEDRKDADQKRGSR